jgi:hypothetical protein
MNDEAVRPRSASPFGAGHFWARTASLLVHVAALRFTLRSLSVHKIGQLICHYTYFVRISTVFVDEAQAVPALFDAVQALFDENKKRWRFILCGSSARKLRRMGANLLPGRSFLHQLQSLILAERPYT